MATELTRPINEPVCRNACNTQTDEDVESKQNAPFKGVETRLIACNGDCGSKIAVIIDYIVHQNKVM